LQGIQPTTVGCNDLKTDWGDGFVVPGFEVKRAAKSLLAAPGNLWVVLVEHGNKWMNWLRSKGTHAQVHREA
jgi:hypothetical protein